MGGGSGSGEIHRASDGLSRIPFARFDPALEGHCLSKHVAMTHLRRHMSVTMKSMGNRFAPITTSASQAG
jgi:hypothetical protein